MTGFSRITPCKVPRITRHNPIRLVVTRQMDIILNDDYGQYLESNLALGKNYSHGTILEGFCALGNEEYELDVLPLVGQPCSFRVNGDTIDYQYVAPERPDWGSFDISFCYNQISLYMSEGNTNRPPVLTIGLFKVIL